MTTTTSLRFTRDGLVNPEAVDVFIAKRLETLVIFSDGSEDAFRQIQEFDFNRLVKNASQIAVARVPLWDLRVYNAEGLTSDPNYVFSDQNWIDWYCSRICGPLMEIQASDVASNSDTKVTLSQQHVNLMCEMAFRFWGMLKVAEDHLAFPAIAIDALTRHSRSLAAEMMDVELLRKETGLETLDYNRFSDLISIVVGGETFTVKRSVLDAFFKNHILPFFNKYQGRRYRLAVSIRGITDHRQVPQVMSYGELGRVIDEMQNLIKKTLICDESPMPLNDLLSYSKKVSIHEESCLFGRRDQTISDFIASTKPVLVHHAADRNRPTQADNDQFDQEPARQAG